MENMFKDCVKLEIAYISKFNTSNITNMKNMFMNCETVTELIVTRF